MRSALPPRVCDVGHRIQFPLMLRRPRGGPRHYPHNGDDFDVIGPDEKIIGRVMKPGGRAEHWFWALKMVVRQQLRRARARRRRARRGSVVPCGVGNTTKSRWVTRLTSPPN